MSEIRDKIVGLKDYMDSRIIGQKDLVKKMIITLLAEGHALVEGAPGLAKTKAIKTLADCISASFNRIQFTPDLLPSDITGSEIYVSQKGEFEFRKGPIFANLVLADEINRAPAKVQSALLEAMAERQVSAGGQRYLLPRLFMVMATQNPIEHEGTYNLPEAQLDRFLMYIKIDQPNAADERKILELVRGEGTLSTPNLRTGFDKIEIADVEAATREALNTHISRELEEYLVQLIVATRKPEKYDGELAGMVMFGASPRATIALDRAAKINAWLAGRDFVTPEDIHAVIYDILRHRIILSFEAQAEGVTSDDIIGRLLNLVPLP
ncbi:MAG: AAA family ATPase [Alphaproteobacteria bacterium]|jgi:MoxR-like ATPase|nr:MAG: AAA family ATPase [Azospirillum sp. 51_20]